MKKTPFVFRVDPIQWGLLRLNNVANRELAAAMFYLGYTDLTIRDCVKRLPNDPDRVLYLQTAISMGFDPKVDTIVKKEN